MNHMPWMNVNTYLGTTVIAGTECIARYVEATVLVPLSLPYIPTLDGSPREEAWPKFYWSHKLIYIAGCLQRLDQLDVVRVVFSASNLRSGNDIQYVGNQEKLLRQRSLMPVQNPTRRHGVGYLEFCPLAAECRLHNDLAILWSLQTTLQVKATRKFENESCKTYF